MIFDKAQKYGKILNTFFDDIDGYIFASGMFFAVISGFLTAIIKQGHAVIDSPLMITFIAIDAVLSSLFLFWLTWAIIYLIFWIFPTIIGMLCKDLKEAFVTAVNSGGK